MRIGGTGNCADIDARDAIHLARGTVIMRNLITTCRYAIYLATLTHIRAAPSSSV